jgi:hypothetical protein
MAPNFSMYSLWIPISVDRMLLAITSFMSSLSTTAGQSLFRMWQYTAV